MTRAAISAIPRSASSLTRQANALAADYIRRDYALRLGEVVCMSGAILEMGDAVPPGVVQEVERLMRQIAASGGRITQIMRRASERGTP